MNESQEMKGPIPPVNFSKKVYNLYFLISVF